MRGLAHLGRFVMRDFRSLTVWKKAHRLALNTYQVTAQLPADERYGLSSQMRRAAASIPTNIAEGCGRSSDNELARFLWIAMGSASELEYQFLLCRDLHLLNAETYDTLYQQVSEVRQMLNGLLRRIAEDS